MPELPEVETIRRNLESHLVSHRIVSAKILSANTAFPSAAFFIKNLVGRRVTGLERRGKLLIFRLSPSKAAVDYLLIHLKMTGQLIYVDSKLWIGGGHSDYGPKKTARQAAPIEEKKLPGKHTRAVINFSGGPRLYFNDLRRFGYLRLVSAKELERIISAGYGPEPLASDFTIAALTAALSGKKVSVKALLLDQKRIAGLGNIYVDESLFAAGIDPRRLAGGLQPAEIRELRGAINRIIRLAIKHRGTTFKDYVDSRGQKGNYSRFLKVYGRGGQACLKCRSKIAKIKLAGRGTHFCPACQV